MIITTISLAALIATTFIAFRQTKELNSVRDLFYEKESIVDALQLHISTLEDLVLQARNENKKLKSEIQSLKDKAKPKAKPTAVETPTPVKKAKAPKKG